MPSQVRALVLDFDGTLVDSEPLHYDCWTQVVRPYGVQISWEDYCRRMVGIHDTEAGRLLLKDAGLDATRELTARVRKEKKHLYRSRFCNELTIAPSICELIQQWARIVPVGVVSSSLTNEVEPLLVQAGLRSSLQFLICGDDVSRLKPHPEPYLTALALVRERDASITAEQCLVFEDSDSGVAAAASAGMNVERVASPEELLDAMRRNLARLSAGPGYC